MVWILVVFLVSPDPKSFDREGFARIAAFDTKERCEMMAFNVTALAPHAKHVCLAADHP